ncbi:unnamed protein product [Durusdinium trenchii]|uniref:Uncharacterized protein n=1 Tax=Durusdinium trenchii TaxID=1381693 RepID=A0ABP0LQS3_9DINO
MPAPRRLLISGVKSCPYYTAAIKCWRPTEVHSELPSLEVQEFSEMAEFHRWAAETGYGAQRSSPLCLLDDSLLGGYVDLRAWLAEHLQGAMPEARIALLSLKKHLRGRWLVDLRPCGGWHVMACWRSHGSCVEKHICGCGNSL